MVLNQYQTFVFICFVFTVIKPQENFRDVSSRKHKTNFKVIARAGHKKPKF